MLQDFRKVDYKYLMNYILLLVSVFNMFIFASLGRTHRSNQVTAPEYMFLISDLAGERRFASTVAKRLESLVGLKHFTLNCRTLYLKKTISY